MPTLGTVVSTSGINVSSLSVDVTCSGDRRYLLATPCTIGPDQPPATVSSVTYGGTSMTQLTNWNLSRVYYRTTGYGLVAPASGTASLSATFSASTYSAGLAGYPFSDVNQATPTGTVATAQGSSTAPSVTVTTETGEIVVDAVACGYASMLVGANQTSQWEAEGMQGDTAAGGSTQNGVDGGVMSWTLSGISASNDWVIGGVSIKHDAGGGGGGGGLQTLALTGVGI